MNDTTPLHELSYKELLRFPEAGQLSDDELIEACEAVQSEEEEATGRYGDTDDIGRVQLLWEYLMTNRPLPDPDSLDITSKNWQRVWDENKQQLSFSAIIIPHLHKLMTEKLGLTPRDMSKSDPMLMPFNKERQRVGAHKDAFHANLLDPPTPPAKPKFWYLFLPFLLMAAFLAAALLANSMTDTVGQLFLAEIVLASLAVGVLFKFVLSLGWVVSLICAAVSFYVLMYAGTWVSNALALDNIDLGQLYLMRGLNAVIGLICLIVFLVRVFRAIHRRQAYNRCYREWEKDPEIPRKVEASNRMKRHLQRCRDVCLLWFKLAAYADSEEAFLENLRQLYDDCDPELLMSGDFEEIYCCLPGDKDLEALRQVANSYKDLCDYYDHL